MLLSSSLNSIVMNLTQLSNGTLMGLCYREYTRATALAFGCFKFNADCAPQVRTELSRKVRPEKPPSGIYICTI